MKPMMIRSFVLSLAVAVAGCSSSPSEPDAQEPAPVAATMAEAAAARDLAAPYAFPIQGEVDAIAVSRATTYRTAAETISRSDTFGEVTGWSRADAPQMQRGWPASLEQHDAMARAWALRVGIPEREIGGVSHWSGHTGGAPATGRASSTPPVSLGFSTTFLRVVDGFLVLESHAGVQLNAEGVPTSFSVAWPEIPRTALAEAHRLANVLARGWQLPEELAGGRPVVRTDVVIRHSLPGSRKAAIRAVLRTELRSGDMTTYLDTDERGERVELVERYAESAPTTK